MKTDSRQIIIDSITEEYQALFNLDAATARKVTEELSLLDDSKLIQEGTHLREYYQRVSNITQSGLVHLIEQDEMRSFEEEKVDSLAFIS